MANQALVNGLGDHPCNFTFTGAIIDTGELGGSSCACGHPIRYEFYVRHKADNKQRVVGSTCIHDFTELNVEEGTRMEKAWEKYQADIKKTKKSLKIVEQTKTLADTKAIYENLWDICWASTHYYEAAKQKMPRELFMPMKAWGHTLCRSGPAQKYKTISNELKWYVTNIPALVEAVTAVKKHIGIENVADAQRMIEVILEEKEKKAREYNWLIDVLNKSKGDFVKHMIQKLKNGEDIADKGYKGFSVRQVEVMRDIFATQFGRPTTATEWRYQKALEYFDKRVAKEDVPEDISLYIIKKQVTETHFDESQTDELPF